MLRMPFSMLCASVAAAVVAGPALATVAIPGLVNSGRVAGGGSVSSGTIADANWLLAGGTAWNSNSINGAWLANNAISRWLTPASNGNQSFDPSADGLYTYSLSFDLAGFAPATAAFTGRFAADNLVTQILLNGVQISQAGGGSFNRWTDFSASSGFAGGLNTLAFTVRNLRQASGNPTGLRVEFLTSTIEPLGSGTAVPEPASWAMLIAGFGLVGAASRRRRQALQLG
jgi:hypothetical protein